MDGQEAQKTGAEQEQEDVPIGIIMITFGCKTYREPIWREDLVAVEIMRAIRNGKDPAKALAQLAEVGAKKVWTDPAYEMTAKAYLGK